MRAIKRFTYCFFLLSIAASIQAQDASSILKGLYTNYKAIPNYKVSVNYVAESDDLGFKNQQVGVLTVVGEKYILKYGPNETWLNDGNAEYIGTKEEDHSEMIIFCIGDNHETPINYGKLFTFFGEGVEASMENGVIKVVPEDGSYKHATITHAGNNIEILSILDEFGMTHTYTFSNFGTNTTGVQFTINPKDYEATVDERQGCK